MRTTDLYTALVAFAIGVGVGVLTAPAKGKDTRRKLMKTATGAKDPLHYAMLRVSDVVGSPAKKVAEPTPV